MTDPIVEAARRAIDDASDTLRRVVDGLPAEALNWKPAGDETNSIAVLTTHAMHATRLLLHIAVGLPQPPRDRPAEFTATADGPGPLLHLVDDLAAHCAATLDTAGSVEWGHMRRRTRDGGEVVEVSAAYALIQAVTHLRGHADEASLTRHLWMAQS
jgi:hypothetical protein